MRHAEDGCKEDRKAQKIAYCLILYCPTVLNISIYLSFFVFTLKIKVLRNPFHLNLFTLISLKGTYPEV